METLHRQLPRHRIVARILAALFLALSAGPLLAQAPRPPELPPHWGDEAYIEALFERYDALSRTDDVVEIERARAKVHYYLTFMDLAETHAKAVANVEQQQAQVERKRALGQELEARSLEQGTARAVAYRDGLAAILTGTANPEQVRAYGSGLGIKRDFYRLTRDEQGKLRPDARRARMEAQIAELVEYSRLVTQSPGSPLPRFNPRALMGIAERYLSSHPGISPEQQDGLVQISLEAVRIHDLVQAGDLPEAQELVDRRWEWIMAWGDEPKAVEASSSSLPRPPALPPRGDDPRYVTDVIKQYEALCQTDRGTLEWLRAQARASWYHNWRKAHEAVERTRITIQSLEKEVAHLRDLAVHGQADGKQELLDHHREQLRVLELALAGGPVEPLIQAKVFTLELPLLSDGRATGQVQPGFTPLGFYGVARISRDKTRTAQRLKAAQGAIVQIHDATAPGPEREELAEYSRELGRCLQLLEANELEELDRIFDERWRWILAWGDDSAFERVDSLSLPDLIVPEPDVPITMAQVKAIKKRMKGQPLIERNRIDLQATFARALQSAMTRPHTGPLSIEDIRGSFGAWGVGWEDVRTGGDRRRVSMNLGRVEQKLSTWIERSKKDSVKTRSEAKQLLERLRDAKDQYEAGEYTAVAEHLAAIRGWILEGSGFDVH